MRLAGFEVGPQTPLFLIAGPCVIESEALVMTTAERLKAITAKLEMPLVFKASFDKANRSSIGELSRPRRRARPAHTRARARASSKFPC